MKFKIFMTGLVLAAGLGTAAGQTETGRVIAAPVFDAGLRMLFSQHDPTYGTARVAAMGGAFTSLGADLSSMSINPAGLGMYHRSDWGFTQALSADGMHTTSPNMRPGTLSAGGGKVSYGLNNVGIAYNVFNSSGTFTSLTIGFGYNRAANFNSRTKIDTFGDNSSIAEMFARQLNYHSIPSSALESSANPFENLAIGFEQWGAVLGYNTGLVGVNGEGEYGYTLGITPTDSYFGSVTKGGVYEYDFSLGANLGNYLYLGATLGATDLNYTENTSYEERYSQSEYVGDMWLDQTTRVTGSGVTAKLGLIARPTEALRIGVAFHLPTYYTTEKYYEGAMGVWDKTTEREHRADTGLPLISTSKFHTAPRLLAGISGIFSSRAIAALDWEVAWYNKMHARNDADASLTQSSNLYKPAHTFRAGLEYILNDNVSLRAGGSLTLDFMRKDDFVANNPTIRNGFSITGGTGFKLGRNGYIDVAYVYNRSKMVDYDFYFFNSEGDIPTSQYDTVNGTQLDRIYTPARDHHMLTVTLGSRF